jgi:uncharacterized protein
MSNNSMQETTDDYKVRSTDSLCLNESGLKHPWWYNFKYMIAGLLFGVLFVKAEIISWFRIQEMFRLQSFHMFGVIGSAIAVATLSIFLIRRLNIKTIYGETVEIHPKTFNKGQVIGGLIFGLGWALTGACPGPLFAQIGSGATSVAITLASALAGTWVYGYFRDRLPH